MNKFKAKKVIENGIKFASKLEHRCYKTLEILVRTKKIDCFEFQVRFEVLEAFKLGKRKVNKIEYIADFVIYKGDSRYIVDSKGVVLSDFKLKKKMFEYKFRETLHIVKDESEFYGLLDIK